MINHTSARGYGYSLLPGVIHSLFVLFVQESLQRSLILEQTYTIQVNL